MASKQRRQMQDMTAGERYDLLRLSSFVENPKVYGQVFDELAEKMGVDRLTRLVGDFEPKDYACAQNAFAYIFRRLAENPALDRQLMMFMGDYDVLAMDELEAMERELEKLVKWEDYGCVARLKREIKAFKSYA